MTDHQGRARPWRWLLSRLALVALGVAGGFVVLEVGLQVGAAVMGLRGQPLPLSWLTGNRRVLCLGDSNTYGLYLDDRNKAYPHQLELLWNTAVRTPRIEALNLGYPGTNSSHLLSNLPRMLEAYRPDVVVVLVGANDSWTAPVKIDDAPGLLARVREFIQAHSRVYQLMYMLGRAQTVGRVEFENETQGENGAGATVRIADAEFSMGWKRGPYRDRAGKALQKNLAAIAAVTQRFGTELILLTYPSEAWNYGDANRSIRAVAQQSAVALADAGAMLKPRCPKEPCPTYLYPDHHPTASGYGLMAVTLMRRMLHVDSSPMDRASR